MVTITKKDFRLYEICKPHKCAFVRAIQLSDFQQYAIKKIGDAIRGPQSQHYWIDQCYMWFTDATQTHRQCVWLTENDILMFEDVSEHKLYRIIFES